MPLESIAVIVIVTAMFASFISVLAWAERQTHNLQKS
jgi:hypothetical protein